ncbi:MAG: HAMP domain-containing protein [Lachnospiraceae bacterium]|nr:HAMP domain-containing protein [Lachnospiraceae bacterium]
MKIMSFWNKTLNRKDNNATITTVLLGSYIRAMIISLVLGIVLFIVITGKEIGYRQSLDNERILSIVTYIIDTKLDDIRQFSDKLVIDDELQDIFTRKEDIRNNLLGGFLMRRMAQQSEISSIHIIWEDSIVSEYKYPVYNYDQQHMIEKLKLNNKLAVRGNFYWEIGTDNGETGENSFYLVGNIKSKAKMEHLGYLIVFLDINQLQQDIDQYLENEMELFIQSDSKEAITFPSTLTMDSVNRASHFIEEKKGQWSDLSDKYKVKELPIVEGVILARSKHSMISPNVEFAIVFMLIIIIEFTIIASIVLKKRVIGPLEEIAARAKEIAVKGNLNIQFPNEKYYSEADDISNALNDMMTQIRGLMEDVENREKLQRQLELSVINHQIKPHFLYNTLNAASILVSVEEKDSANQLITTLASYYRACLNHGNDIITLENELNIVRDYIKIVLIRNPNILKLQYDIDKDLLDLQIPKMTIQTLVENSIKYGIKAIGQPVSIIISIRKRKAFAEIIVEDDGVGMSQDTIDRIMKGEQLDVKSGFGLKSVLNRLTLLYDQDMDEIMDIQSKQNCYTKIILRLYWNKN